jgi:PAS domain-containing protein
MNHNVCHDSMSLPDTPSPPRFLLRNQDHVVFIDTEGGLCFLHPERYNALDPIRFPFPGVITNAVLLGPHLLVSTWVEREISLARLAALDLREPLRNGVELPDLRMAMELGQIDHHQVEGATWSHVLDAEPLALCVHDEDLIFCTHHRGLYRVTSYSDEVWRRKPITWESLDELPDGDVIVSLISKDDSIWAFSLGGGWAEINATDGSVIRRGALQFKSSVNQVWSGNENEWLFGLSHNRIAWWIPDQDQLQMETVQGPIQDAICSEGNWLITGWREDIVWKKSDLSDDHSEPSCTARAEIGTRIVNRNGEGHWVLDNRGKWTRFASKSD